MDLLHFFSFIEMFEDGLGNKAIITFGIVREARLIRILISWPEGYKLTRLIDPMRFASMKYPSALLDEEIKQINYFYNQQKDYYNNLMKES